MKKTPFRLGQRLCRVWWKDGQPFMQFGTVTKVTTQTYYVNNEKKPTTKWRGNADMAFEDEYMELLQMWGLPFPRRPPKDWTIQDTVRCVCRVRRLERRLLRRKKK